MKNTKHLKGLITIFLLSSIGWTSCCKHDKEIHTECLNSKIAAFSSAISCSTGVSVEQYFFLGKIVYVFNPGNCGADMAAGVVDDQCNEIGYLGGIAGNTIVQGADFTKATFIKTIWKK